MEIGFAFLLGGAVMFLLHAAWLRGFDRGVATKLTAAPPIDLNSANEAALAQAPGIGPQRARRIVERRELAGPFGHLDELQEVHGIGPYTSQKARPALRLSGTETTPVSAPTTDKASGRKSPPPQPLDLNLATADELQALPGIGPVLAERIVAYREAHGPFVKVEDVTRVPGIKEKTLAKVRPFVMIDQRRSPAPTTPL
jgi:competence ComEA-like helix-hairpin-helix protein